MFLSDLSKKEKKLFMDLAIFIVNLDGEVSNHEQFVLSVYAAEMKTNYDISSSQTNPDEVIKELYNISTPQVLRGFLTELIALANVDGEYSTLELNFIETIAESWDYNRETIQKIISLQESYSKVLIDIMNFVEKGE